LADVLVWALPLLLLLYAPVRYARVENAAASVGRQTKERESIASIEVTVFLPFGGVTFDLERLRRRKQRKEERAALRP